MVGTSADRRRQDDWREDADAVGAEILDEPRTEAKMVARRLRSLNSAMND
jgi:hypothetical protein